MTLGDLQKSGLAQHPNDGFQEAFTDLLAHHFQLSRLDLFTRSELELPPGSVEAFYSDLELFLSGTPIPYITGEAHFFGRRFYVNPQVLIPRPDTECLIERALSLASPQEKILDLGCGSGILAITMALEWPSASIWGTDSSAAALRVAQHNACRHAVSDRISLHHCDLFPHRSACPERGFDLILSNPPYIAAAEWPELDPSVRMHEPRAALQGGEDGLSFYRRILSAAHAHLQPGGRLMVEVGYRQARRVGELFLESGFHSIEYHRDLSLIERVVSARLG